MFEREAGYVHPYTTEQTTQYADGTGLPANFTHISGADSPIEDFGVSLAALIVAEACNVGLVPIEKPNVPALTRARLLQVDQGYLRGETIAAANVRLIAALGVWYFIPPDWFPRRRARGIRRWWGKPWRVSASEAQWLSACSNTDRGAHTAVPELQRWLREQRGASCRGGACGRRRVDDRDGAQTQGATASSAPRSRTPCPMERKPLDPLSGDSRASPFTPAYVTGTKAMPVSGARASEGAQ
ncbi:Tn3 family transposase [Nonomuraea sp. NPDC003707]